MEDRNVRQLVVRAEALLRQLESLEEGQARALALDAIQTLFELYGEGLARMMDQASQEKVTELLERYRQDELVSHLLLMHGLHPDDVETRVQQALDEVRPYMETHGGNVELLSVQSGIAYLRLVGSCHGCAASSTTMKLAVEKAVQRFAPDLLGIEAEGALPPPPGPLAGFVPVTSLGMAQKVSQHG